MRYLAIIFGAVLLLAGWSVQAQDEAEEPQSQEETEEEQDARRRVRRLGDVVGEGDAEWSMDVPVLDVPTDPVDPPPDVSLPDPEQDSRLQSLLTTRAFVPNDPDVQAALSDLMDEVEIDVREALEADDLELAGRLIAVISEVDPEREVIAEVQAELDRLASVGDLLAQGNEALAERRLVTPPGDNAAEYYREVLDIEPDNEAALAGLVNTHQALLAEAVELAEETDFEGAEERLEQAGEVHEDSAAVEETRAAIVEIRDERIAQLDGRVLSAIDEGRFDDAEDDITQLVALGHDRDRIDRLRNSLEDARLYGSFEPGQVFNDTLEGLGVSGPDMVVIPAGSFMMGSPEDEDDRMSNEGPRHRVTFARGFALGQTDITVGEFRAFVEATGYRTDAERTGASRVYDLNSGRMDRKNGINWRHDYAGDNADDNLPVLHVSWNDAEAYAGWLAEQTGRSYRLPSEAEFEYALRAGTQTPYWWGDGAPDRPVENVTGDGDQSPTGARWNVAFRRYSSGYWGPAPVGSLEANPFGLYDMGGNVMNWVEDCWHDSYVRAPGDGSAWVNPGCDRRVIRGGAWSSTPALSRSAFRISSSPTGTDMRVGFRVARDL
jgi:formylglycine-generating enzyme required for sulfatase activity